MILDFRCKTVVGRRVISSLFLTLISLVIQAHEFWLQPSKFRYALNEEAVIDFLVGENFTGEVWDLRKHKIELLQWHTLTNAIDLSNQVKDIKGFQLKQRLSSEGTHLFAMKSNAAYIELAADKFNQYLKDDGLDYILNERKSKNQFTLPSTENYTRFAKLLVQSGSLVDGTYKKKVGFRLEIVPQSNPYTLKSGDYLQCQVLFEGKPLPHTLVKVWSRLNRTTFLQNIYTEKDGTLKFPISTKGAWMISTVKMLSNDLPTSQYHSLWGSLVFGIE